MTLDSIWTSTNSVLVLKRLLGNLRGCSEEGQRDAQAGEGKHTVLTLLSPPYLIISWAKSSVGLTRTNAWTLFLVPIPAKKKKIAKFSVVILQQPLERRCHSSRRSENMMCSPCFPLPLRASLPFCPPAFQWSVHRTLFNKSVYFLLYRVPHHSPPTS